MMRSNLRKAVARAHARLLTAGKNERGDAVGWVLIAVMTAGIIAVLWAAVGPQLTSLVQEAINKGAGK